MPIINYVTKVHFDFGAIGEIAGELRAAGVYRPLIVTDAGIEGAGLLGKVRAVLERPEDAVVFSETPSNPTEAAARAAAEIYAQADCDGLLAVGGGSPLDLAKSVAILTCYDSPLEAFAFNTAGINVFDKPLPPVFAVPTTAGTGSEVGTASLMTFTSGRKAAILSPAILPRVSFCDPDLTVGLPPFLTAATGMDALSHCVETFLSPRINPPADAIALDGLRRGFGAIERATGDGSDRAARHDMMMAAMQGAMCFQKGLGAVHSMSHPLGSLGHHHGTLNAILLPIVLRYNAAQVPQKMDRIAEAIGADDGTTVAESFRALNARLGIPASLGALGVTPDDLIPLPDMSLIDGAHQTNPRAIDRAAYVDLYAQALAG